MTFYIAFVSGEESRVGWMPAVGGMAAHRVDGGGGGVRY